MSRSRALVLLLQAWMLLVYLGVSALLLATQRWHWPPTWRSNCFIYAIECLYARGGYLVIKRSTRWWGFHAFHADSLSGVAHEFHPDTLPGQRPAMVPILMVGLIRPTGLR